MEEKSVLIINGSPRTKSNSSLVIEEIKKVLNEYNFKTNVLEIGNKDIRGCIACGACKKLGKCVFNDEVNEGAKLFNEASGLIVVSPVYYASPNGTLISFLDRLFQSASYSKKMKVGASFVIARRGGTTASFDVLNKYFTISGMPIVSGDYWNNVFGRLPGEVEYDKEGLRNVRVVAKRMVFLMNAISDAKKNYPDLLQDEERTITDFYQK